MNTQYKDAAADSVIEFTTPMGRGNDGGGGGGGGGDVGKVDAVQPAARDEASQAQREQAEGVGLAFDKQFGGGYGGYGGGGYGYPSYYSKRGFDAAGFMHANRRL